MTRAALERMATGDYGACLRCGREISAARLHSLPMGALLYRLPGGHRTERGQ